MEWSRGSLPNVMGTLIKCKMEPYLRESNQEGFREQCKLKIKINIYQMRVDLIINVTVNLI